MRPRSSKPSPEVERWIEADRPKTPLEGYLAAQAKVSADLASTRSMTLAEAQDALRRTR